jgi:hypothetical protein
LTFDHYRAALQSLLQGPAPLVHIARNANVNNEQGQLEELREHGLDVLTVAESY